MAPKTRNISKIVHSGSPSEVADALSGILTDIRSGQTTSALKKIRSQRKIVDQHELTSYLAGLLRVSRGEFSEACAHFDRVLALNPEHLLALYGRAVARQNSGLIDGALKDYQKVLNLDPANAEAWFNYGTACQLAKMYDDALTAYSKAVGLAPNSMPALTNLATVLQVMNHDTEALDVFGRALALQADDKSLWYNCGVSNTKLGRLDAALTCYKNALRIDSGYLIAADGALYVMEKAKAFKRVIAFAEEILTFDPRHVPALISRANALHKLGELRAAVEAFDQALACSPNDPLIHTNKGMTLLELGQLEAAGSCAKVAIKIDRRFALAWRCLGTVQMRTGAHKEGLISFDRALTLASNDPDVLCGRAIILKELGRFDEAFVDFDRALAINPDHNEAKANKGGLHLLLGDYARGWDLFEYRWILGGTPKVEAKYPWPEWHGEDLSGKHILIYDEAGLGDVLQFTRYLPLLVDAGAKVSFLCRPAMKKILAGLREGIDFISQATPDAGFDYCATLCSLPRAFGTRLETIPAPKYLRVDFDKYAAWGDKIRRDGVKIGICWQGSAHAKSDHTRAAPLAAFAPLAKIEGVRLISLQKDFGTEQLDQAPMAMKIETLGPEFDAGIDAFVDAAAVIKNLDLVITIDTSIAHLSGVLKKPTWLALKSVPEWRWMTDRADSPWYPTLRLFRQAQGESWETLFERMAQDLDRFSRDILSKSTTPVLLPGSVGDLIDRLTILEIKKSKISDARKLSNVNYEFDLLQELKYSSGFDDVELLDLECALKRTNQALWQIEDDIRECEARQEFGEKFIRLARSVYVQNDERAKLKKMINLLCKSSIVEEKSYAGIEGS